MSSYFSPKEVAVAIGMSESSLKRWVDKGKIRASKTAGGHRRLLLSDVLDYIRASGRGLRQADAIGLPDGCGTTVSPDVESSRKTFLAALIAGEEQAVSRIILDAYLSGISIATICDSVIADGFHEIGDLWKCGDVKIHEERRACELCSRVLHDLRKAVGEGPIDGPVAIGGSLEGDPYTLAASMAEVALRNSGWRASLLGNTLPFASFQNAIVDLQPDLVWLSVTAVADVDKFCSEFNLLFDVAQSTSTALIVGGQGLTSELREKVRCTQFFDSFSHLESFSKTIGFAERSRRDASVASEASSY